jgi:hypothetical protein
MRSLITRLCTVAAMLGVAAVACGCGVQSEALPSGREVTSVMSPDGVSRAFVWIPTTSGFLGATSSEPYQVWIQYLQGEKKQQLVFEAAQTDGISVTWRSVQQLEICYGFSSVYKFHNLFEHAEQHSQKLYEVEVLLRRADKLTDCK